MKVLVTGGAGFIGSHVVDALRRCGHEPLIYDLRHSPHHADVETVIGDLGDTERLTEALAGCDAIAHLAASADVDEVKEDPLLAERINSAGTISVLEAARRAGVPRVVYASTIWVYSDVEGDHVDEDTPLVSPSHLYTATKLAGEHYCKSYSELYGVDYTVLRFGIPYGPRARPAAVLPIFVRKALAGEPLTLAGGGTQTRRFVYVEDLAEGVVKGLAPGAANRTYNLVSTEDVSIRDVAETVRDLIGNVEIEITPGRAGDFKGAEVDGTRAERELGWTASTPFREGARRYVTWLQTEPLAITHQSARDVARVRATGVSRELARHMAPLSLLAVFVAAVAAAGSVSEVIEQGPLAALVMALGLPLVLARALRDRARRFAPLFAAISVLCVLGVALRHPNIGMAHNHAALTLLVAASSAVAAMIAAGIRVPVLRERYSD